MSALPRGAGWLVVCLACATGAACGTADDPVDPHDLALRDLLGVAPRVAVAWDADQRAAARDVLAGGLRRDDALALPRQEGDAAAVISGLAAVDRAREGKDEDALGLVVIASDARAIDGAIAGAALLGAVPGPMALEFDPRAWPCASEPCDLAILEALAADAAPGAALVRVEPAAQLAVIAALVPGVDGVPTLLVNPIVTAVADDAEATPGAGGAAATTRGGARSSPALPPPPPLTRGAWTYGASVSACAEQVRTECDVCQTGGTCATVWPGVTGADACAMLDADEGRNYQLVCIDLAVSLADVRSCVQGRSSACAIDVDAIDDPSQLAANAVFLDDITCSNHLAVCLDQLYGARDDADGCDACDGCSCDDDSDDSGGACSNDNDDMDDGCNGGGCGDSDGCSGGGCNDSSGGNGCGGGGGGGNGSCAVASRSGRGPGLAIGLAWLLIPVPVALRARRRRRDGALTDDAPLP